MPKSKSKSSDGSDYPNIIEEPTRIVGDQKPPKSKTAKSKKQATTKSGKGPSRKVGKKRR